MADSRALLPRDLLRLVERAEANGHAVHVYRVNAADCGRKSVIMFAIDGFPRQRLDDCLSRLKACAAYRER